uniref:DNA damage-binding protein 1 n=1 Tax=Solanum tuberosum TaxID=4113 RepID=M0ZWK6_SOLTU
MVTGQLKGSELLGKKKLSLGTQPVTLCAFLFNEATRIFASSNTSMAIYNSIFCCEVNNLNDVRLMSPYRVEAFPNSALHISHQEQSHTIAICTVKRDDKDDMVSLVQLFDDQTCHRKWTYKLKEFEHSCSLISCSFSEDDNVYYCVGTAYLKLDANECTKGRILVLQVVQGSKLHLVAEMETDGAVYCLNAFTGKLLAAINQNIKLYKWASLKSCRGRELKPGCLYWGSVLSRFIQTHGDAMRSISLLRLKVLVVIIYLKK